MPVFLIILGLGLIVYSTRKLYKTKDHGFSSSFKKSKVDITEFDIKLGEMRREFSETILELQKEVDDLKDKLVENSKVVSPKKEVLDIINAGISLKENNSFKINEISILFSEGLTVEEISERLNINKGEVLLIKELYLK